MNPFTKFLAENTRIAKSTKITPSGEHDGVFYYQPEKLTDVERYQFFNKNQLENELLRMGMLMIQSRSIPFDPSVISKLTKKPLDQKHLGQSIDLIMAAFGLRQEDTLVYFGGIQDIWSLFEANTEFFMLDNPAVVLPPFAEPDTVGDLEELIEEHPIFDIYAYIYNAAIVSRFLVPIGDDNQIFLCRKLNNGALPSPQVNIMNIVAGLPTEYVKYYSATLFSLEAYLEQLETMRELFNTYRVMKINIEKEAIANSLTEVQDKLNEVSENYTMLKEKQAVPTVVQTATNYTWS